MSREKRTIINNMRKLGDFLKEKRKEKGYSLRDLERIAGVTHPHIRYIEEEMRKPTFDVVMKLLSALNVEASEFLIETGYMRPITTSGKGKRIPVLSWVRAGHWKEASELSKSADFARKQSQIHPASFSVPGPFRFHHRGTILSPDCK